VSPVTPQTLLKLLLDPLATAVTAAEVAATTASAASYLSSCCLLSCRCLCLCGCLSVCCFCCSFKQAFCLLFLRAYMLDTHTQTSCTRIIYFSWHKGQQGQCARHTIIATAGTTSTKLHEMMQSPEVSLNFQNSWAEAKKNLSMLLGVEKTGWETWKPSTHNTGNKFWTKNIRRKQFKWL